MKGINRAHHPIQIRTFPEVGAMTINYECYLVIGFRTSQINSLLVKNHSNKPLRILVEGVHFKTLRPQTSYKFPRSYQKTCESMVSAKGPDLTEWLERFY